MPSVGNFFCMCILIVSIIRKKLMLDNTYGSMVLWEKTKDNLLFENLYDYWTCCHDSNRITGNWYEQKMWFLEQTIRRKWKQVKDLPLVNIIFKKFKEKDIFFNP